MDLRHLVPLPSGRDAGRAAVLGAAVLAGGALVAYLQPGGALGPVTVAAVLVAAAAWAWHRVAPVVSAAVVSAVVLRTCWPGSRTGRSWCWSSSPASPSR